MTNFLALAAGFLAVAGLFSAAFILEMRVIGGAAKRSRVPLWVIAAGLVVAAVWLTALGLPSVAMGAGVAALLVVAVTLAAAVRASSRKGREKGDG